MSTSEHVLSIASAAKLKKHKCNYASRLPIVKNIQYLETIFNKFTGFSRIITRTQEEALIVQNRMPGAIYVLPPGRIRVKLTQELPNTSGDYMHTGGWMIIHKYLYNN